MSMTDAEFLREVGALLRLCNRAADLNVDYLLAEIESDLRELTRVGPATAGSGLHNTRHIRALAVAAKGFRDAVLRIRAQAPESAGGYRNV